MDTILTPKTYRFALRCVYLYKLLLEREKEYVLSKQLLRSGTSVGALVRESKHAQSRKDFLNKLNIALKEANESEYWLMLLKDAHFISDKEYSSIHKDCNEIISLLVSIVKTLKSSI